jgi:hypothetical protein
MAANCAIRPFPSAAPLKVLRRKIGSFGGAWGFGADLGAQYRKGNWMFGMQGRDLTTTFNAWSFNLTEREKEVFTATNNEIPSAGTEITRPRFILGAAYRAKIGQKPPCCLPLTWNGPPTANATCSSAQNQSISTRVSASKPTTVALSNLRIGAGNFQRVKGRL